MTIKLLITGSRDWPFPGMVIGGIEQVFKDLGQWDYEYQMPGDRVVLVHGGCPRGVDHFADEWATVNFHPQKIYKANWKQHGRAAGFKRNEEMVLDNLDAYLALAFCLDKSKGTMGCVKLCRKHGIPVRLTELTTAEFKTMLCDECVRIRLFVKIKGKWVCVSCNTTRT